MSVDRSLTLGAQWNLGVGSVSERTFNRMQMQVNVRMRLRRR